MIASDFTEVVLIDNEITQLQSQLSELYERRRSILNPIRGKIGIQEQGNNRVNFSSLDLSIDPRTSLTLSRPLHRK